MRREPYKGEEAIKKKKTKKKKKTGGLGSCVIVNMQSREDRQAQYSLQLAANAVVSSGGM